MKRWLGLAALAIGVTVAGGGVVSANTTQPVAHERSTGILSAARAGLADLAHFVGIDEATVAPGTLDDGKELLPQAGITLEQAVAAAQASTSGDVGEVDLEYSHGTLVFNVDVGNHDVKVDATTGTVLGSDQDD